MVEMMTSGIATVSVDGMTVTMKSMAEMKSLLDLIDDDLVAEDTTVSSSFGIRAVKLVPPGCG